MPRGERGRIPGETGLSPSNVRTRLISSFVHIVLRANQHLFWLWAFLAGFSPHHNGQEHLG